MSVLSDYYERARAAGDHDLCFALSRLVHWITREAANPPEVTELVLRAAASGPPLEPGPYQIVAWPEIERRVHKLTEDDSFLRWVFAKLWLSEHIETDGDDESRPRMHKWEEELRPMAMARLEALLVNLAAPAVLVWPRGPRRFNGPVTDLSNERFEALPVKSLMDFYERARVFDRFGLNVRYALVRLVHWITRDPQNPPELVSLVLQAARDTPLEQSVALDDRFPWSELSDLVSDRPVDPLHKVDPLLKWVYAKLAVSEGVFDSPYDEPGDRDRVLAIWRGREAELRPAAVAALQAWVDHLHTDPRDIYALERMVAAEEGDFLVALAFAELLRSGGTRKIDRDRPTTSEPLLPEARQRWDDAFDKYLERVRADVPHHGGRAGLLLALAPRALSRATAAVSPLDTFVLARLAATVSSSRRMEAQTLAIRTGYEAGRLLSYEAASHFRRGFREAVAKGRREEALALWSEWQAATEVAAPTPEDREQAADQQRAAAAAAGSGLPPRVPGGGRGGPTRGGPGAV